MIPVDDDALASPIADGSRLCESQEECRSSIPPDDWLTSNDAHEDVSQEGLECPECRSLVPESRLASQGGVRAATAAHDATSSHSSCAHAPLASLSLSLSLPASRSAGRPSPAAPSLTPCLPSLEDTCSSSHSRTSTMIPGSGSWSRAGLGSQLGFTSRVSSQSLSANSRFPEPLRAKQPAAIQHAFSIGNWTSLGSK